MSRTGSLYKVHIQLLSPRGPLSDLTWGTSQRWQGTRAALSTGKVGASFHCLMHKYCAVASVRWVDGLCPY